MKRLIFPKVRYPKTLLLALMILLAYWLFSNPLVSFWVSHLGGLSYAGTFIAGLLFSFGFTTPFAVGYFVSLDPANIWVHGLIGGAGALISDLFIFHFIRFSFMDELGQMKKNKLFTFIGKTIDKSLGARLGNYFMYLVAGFIISSPLPDEVGVTMLAGLTKINQFVLGIISFIFNSLGIIVLLLI